MLRRYFCISHMKTVFPEKTTWNLGENHQKSISIFCKSYRIFLMQFLTYAFESFVNFRIRLLDFQKFICNTDSVNAEIPMNFCYNIQWAAYNEKQGGNSK